MPNLQLGNLLTAGNALLAFPNKYSFNFDGSNDYLDCGDSSVLKTLGNSSFSFSAWINSDLDSSDDYIFSNSTGTDKGILGRVTSANKFRVLVLTNGSVFDGAESSVLSSGWNHVASSWDGSTMRIYINGTEDTTRVNQGTLGDATSTNNFEIGKLSNGSSYFDGLIDEVAIWDTALSSDDVAKIASKPVDFSKASTYATDRTSNLKLWLRAGDKAEPESTTAIARQDFYSDFDGVNDYVNIGQPSSLTNLGASDFTIMCWVNPDSVAGWVGLVYIGQADSNNGHLGINPSGFLSGGTGNSTDWVSVQSSTDVLVVGEWVHCAMVRENNIIYLYKNGVEIKQGSHNVTPNALDEDAWIGRGASSEYYNGKISNASVYQTALDAQTISQMAKSRFTPMRDNRFSVVDFDGSNDYIALSSDISLTGEFTFNFWYNTTHTGTNYLLGHSTEVTFVRIQNTGERLAFKDTDGVSYSTPVLSTVLPLDGTWNNITITRDSSNTIKCYLNGSEVGELTNKDGEFDINEIGNINANLEYNGSLSSVSIYNTAKSAEEVYAIYQQGITYDESSLSGLQGYWRMGDDTSKAYPTIADSSSNSNDGTITNGASDDIVQQMVGGWDLGSFESSSEELSANHLDNGDFSDGNTDWTEVGDFTISNGVASITSASQYSQLTAYSSNFLNSGKTYKLEVDITTLSISGALAYRVSGGDVTPITTSEIVNDKYTTYFTMTQDGWFWFQTTGSYTGLNVVIDNVSVKEVLQSEVSDTHPFIADVNEPVLGVEIFPDSNSLYTLTNANYEKDSANPPNLTYLDTGTGAVTINDSDLEESVDVSATYKFTMTISGLTSGQANFALQSSNGAYNYITEGLLDNGIHTFYFTKSAGSGAGVRFRSDTASGSTFTISDYSLKRVLGNVGTMTQMDGVSNLVYSSVLADQSFLTGVNSAYNFVSLDGANDYVNTGSPFQSTFRDSFSISAWIKLTDGIPPTENNIFGARGSGGRFYFSIDTVGKLRVYLQTNIAVYAITNSVTFSNGQEDWHHVCAVINNSTNQISLYLNSLELTLDPSYDGDISSLTLNTFTSTDNVYIGARNDEGTADRFFNGDMGQTAFWSKALSSTEVSAIYTAGRHSNLLNSYSDNLKAYYAFGALDAVTGLSDTTTTIYDRSGNSNHGTPVSIASSDLKSSPNAEPNGYAKGDTNRSTTTP